MFSYKVIKLNWLITTFILKLSGLWFSLILSFWGTKLGLIVVDKNENRNFTFLGACLTGIIVIISIYIPIVERYHDQYDNDFLKTQAERDLLKKVNGSVNDICKSKMNNQLNKIRKVREKKTTVPMIYTKPCNQIKKILDEFINCLSVLVSDNEHSFDKDDFVISLLYNFPNENKDSWKWAGSYSQLVLNEKDVLLPESTFSHLIGNDGSNKSKPYVFFNNKQKAFENHHYIPDSLDHYDDCNKLVGSIGCFLMNFGDNAGNEIRAAICFSTHGKQIIDEKDYIEKIHNTDKLNKELKRVSNTLAYNINNNLVKYFKYRIGIELCNCYMQFLQNKYAVKQDDKLINNV